MATADRSTDAKTFGRFRSRYFDADLERIVKEAAQTFCPDNPHKLSQSRFDGGRADLGYPDAPTARQICSRLKRSWPVLVALVLDEGRDLDKSREAVDREPEAPWLDQRHIFFALNRVASHLELKSLKQNEYTRGREELIADDRRRHRYGGVLEESLPTVGQIESAADRCVGGKKQAWDKALLIAKLEPRERSLGKGTPIYLVVHHYIEATGCKYLPSWPELERFAAAANISMMRLHRTGKTIGEHRHECAAYRKKLGLKMPSKPLPRGVKPVFSLDPNGYPDAVQRRTREWTDEAIVHALCEYIEAAEAVGARPSRNHYISLQVGNRAWPAPAHFAWKAMLQQAYDELRKRRQLQKAA